MELAPAEQRLKKLEELYLGLLSYFALYFIINNKRYLTDSVLKLQSVPVFLNMFKLQSKVAEIIRVQINS